MVRRPSATISKVQERLQKIIARAGVTSRRKAEALISSGRVTINGKVVTRLGSKADPQRDHIKVDNRLLQSEPLVYLLLNKPQGVLCSASDERGRTVVTDLAPAWARVYPAGRLDFDSEGLVILTNDGDLASALTEAGKMEKVYRVKVCGRPSEGEISRLTRGIMCADGQQLGPCRIRPLKFANNCWYEVRLRQGRNRQIRRMFETIGHRVMRLRRTNLGPIALGDLPPGKWRLLTGREIERLKRGARRVNVSDPQPDQ